MKPSLKCLLGAVLALGLTLAAHAQGLVSSGLTGLVRDTGGRPVPGATVKAVHTPTGTSYTATTNPAGRYSFSGMMVGGPYTVSVMSSAYKSSERTGVETQLGGSVDANFTIEGVGEVVTMQKYTVIAGSNDLDSSATGAGSIISGSRLGSVPTVMRSFADVARTNQFVNLRGILASRQQPVISAVGQNNRFNSILVDGARINDQFGLNGSGLQAFGNPITLDTVEQFNVSVSPYDISQSGFTGASINAVTKSGTNEFHGSAYYYFTNQDYQGRNVFGSTAGIRPNLEQKTKGFTLGGPIVPNRLFFFMNYERFDSVTSDLAGLDPTGTPQGVADMAIISARLAAIKASPAGSSYDFGTLMGKTSSVQQFDTKKLAKLDWNISSTQRFSVRYNKTEGELPDSGKYKYGGSVGTTQNPASGSGIANATYATNLSSNRFAQVRSEEVWASQLFSQWSSDFKTQFRYAQNHYTQQTPTPIAFPEVHIYNVGGTASSGASITNGALVFGTELNRHGNAVDVKTKSFSGSGEYLWDKFTFKGGFDREQSDFYNLFRSSSYGTFDYASPAAFAADTPSAFIRNYYVTGTNPADVSNFAINGLFSQAKWDVNSRLNLTAGLRYDLFTTSGPRPPRNELFRNVFGVANDATVDGSNSISPRLSFNLALDDERTIQVRGGAGRFLGRLPWVLASNSWSNPGIGRTQITTINSAATPAPTLSSYLQSSFDPKDPVGQVASASIGRPVINLMRDKLSAPAVWRGNLALDHKLPFFDSMLSAEAVVTTVDKAIFIRDLNLKASRVGSDGRQLFAGSLSTAANAAHPEFSNVYELGNVSKGGSAYFSLSLSRPMKNRWSYTATYTRGSSKDALLLGETVASSLFNRNPIFNQNTPEVSRSAFEVKNRIQINLAREFEFFKKAKTVISLLYDGRTGNPYSYVYSGDVNGDGVQANDLIYVPTGVNDPVLAGLSPAVAASYVAFVNSTPLQKYAGSIAPRNGFTVPWTNRLDLHIGQTLPLGFRTAEVEVFADFINFGAWLSKDVFGYTETITGSGDNELLAVSNFGNAAYNAAGQLQMSGAAYVAPVVATPNNELSRWRIQFGARVRF